MSTLSTHVLDTSLGKPAPGIKVTLERGDDLLGSGETDADGRLRDLLKENTPLSAGSYQLTFYVADYFSRAGREFFVPEVVVAFRVGEGEDHYHVPLLISPFGYSTYRGS